VLKIPYELWIGARYAGMARIRQRRGRRDRFISFIAATSMAGIALGVAALIVVLSVMNGFQKEVRDRMLSVLPHIELYIPGAVPERVLEQWRQFADAAERNPEVKGAAPFVAAQAMLARGQALRGVQVRGIDPVTEGQVSDIPRQMTSGKLADLKPGGFGVVLGSDLADGLGVQVGDTLLMLAPQGSISPAGFTPRMRQFTVVGTFTSGHYEYDSSRRLSMTRTPPGCSATAAPPACACACRTCSAPRRWRPNCPRRCRPT
jgi:lipoprotein-releasing system permease protein